MSCSRLWSSNGKSLESIEILASDLAGKVITSVHGSKKSQRRIGIESIFRLDQNRAVQFQQSTQLNNG
jgi:hypothetical protein